MTTLALGVAGAVIGGAIGATVGAPMLGASIGWSLGSYAGTVIDPQTIEGPRLNDKKLTNSVYGAPIPIVYGSYRLAGSVIWQTDLEEHESTSGGKGAPEVTTFTYSASFAVLICVGPIVRIDRIWADGRLIRDPANDLASDLPIVIYLGTESQLPDPTMEADKGAGNVPAHRGTAYVVFTDWLLTDFGNRIPNLEFEVVTGHIADCPVAFISKAPTSISWALPARPSMSEWDGEGEPDIVAEPVAMVEVSGGVGIFGWTYVIYPGPLHIVGGAARQMWSTFSEFTRQPGEIDVVLGYGVASVEYIVAPPYTHSSHVTVEISQSCGIASGTFLRSVVGSYDNTKLFVFTADVSGDGADITKWWMLVNGKLVKSGTVDPPLSGDFEVFGNSGHTNYTNHSAQFENNGRYCWYVTDNNFIKCFWIDDDDNFAQICSSVSVDPITGLGFYASSVLAYTEGKCVMVAVDQYCVLRRHAAGETEKVTLASIVADISDRCTLDASEYDVSELTDLVTGYFIPQQMDGRAAIQPLMPAYFFDATESDEQIKFLKRGREPVATITDDELAAHQDGEDLPPLLEITRHQEDDMPSAVSVSYMNQVVDYQPGIQLTRRQVGDPSKDVNLQTALVLADQEAKRIADALLYSTWYERNGYKFQTTRKYLALDPGDVMVVDDRRLRLTHRLEHANGVIAFDAVPDLESIWVQSGVGGDTGGGFVPPTTPQAHDTDLVLLNAPLTNPEDFAAGYYVAMADNAGRSWPGAVLYVSKDEGSTWTEVVSGGFPDTFGTASTTLGSFAGGNTFDEANSVTVVLTPGAGELASATELAVLNGANLAAVGDELIQYKVATLTAERTYVLTGLLRGRSGTEFAMSTHVADEDFVVLPTNLQAPSASAEIGHEYWFKPVTAGTTLDLATITLFTNTGAAARPYAPVQLGGGRNAAGDVELRAIRRERVSGDWLDHVDVPMDEVPEHWNFIIYASSGYATVKNTYTLYLSPSTEFLYTYTAAQQTTDFGSTQSTVYWGLQRIGLVPGTEARRAT